MATVQETIHEIEEFQNEVLNSNLQDEFCHNLLRITSVIYLDYLSHAILGGAKKENLYTAPYAEKYYKIVSLEFLHEQIRINSLGQLFNIWNIYESFLRKKSNEIFGEEDRYISRVFKKIIEKFDDNKSKVILSEFDVIRHTRNSFHNGGIFKENSTGEKELRGKKYIFKKDEPVKPVRNMDIIQTVWKHFIEINKIPATSKS